MSLESVTTHFNVNIHHERVLQWFHFFVPIILKLVNIADTLSLQEIKIE
jgi:hypothetical protein